jgi:hypothetical protein
LAQIVGLMCVRQARDGYSQYASGLAVHNEILATRPDFLMPILYRGFPHHRRGEEAPTASPITLMTSQSSPTVMAI